MRQEGSNITRNRHTKEQPHLGSERKIKGICRKTIGLEIMKRAVWISSGLQKMGNWTLWMVGPIRSGKSRTGHCGVVGLLQNGRETY
jgi:hypothetical protein